MISNLKRLHGLLSGRLRAGAPPTPEQPFVAVGDIHGCDGLVEVLLHRIGQEAPGYQLVFVGDYIDRGPDSQKVLQRMFSLCQAADSNVECLMGNHEKMLLDFLDLPEQNGQQWLRNGGCQTLESFGIYLPESEIDLAKTSADLATAMGENLICWLRERPLVWQTGNVVVTHAGADPRRDIDPRRDHPLLWGHRDFRKLPRTDGLWVVHGHFIVKVAAAKNGCISIDTGAFSTGRLTAAIVTEQEVKFLST